MANDIYIVPVGFAMAFDKLSYSHLSSVQSNVLYNHRTNYSECLMCYYSFRKRVFNPSRDNKPHCMGIEGNLILERQELPVITLDIRSSTKFQSHGTFECFRLTSRLAFSTSLDGTL